MSRKIVYEDISPTASASAVAEVTDFQSFCDPQLLFKDSVSAVPVMTCEHGQTILDGTYDELNTDIYRFALWSSSQSNDNAEFDIPIDLTVDFGGALQSSVGITIRADTVGGTWPAAVNIKWYRSGSLLSETDFHPDSAEYMCLNRVEYYDRLEFCFCSWSLPNHFLKLEKIPFGITRTFGDNELETLEIYEAVDLTGVTLSINSMSCTINAKGDLAFMFQERQPLSVYWNDELMGTFFVDEWDELAASRFELDNIDRIGVTDSQSEYRGGIYEGELAGDVIVDIFGDEDAVEIEAEIYNTRLYGWLPKVPRRSALAHIAVATGACIDTSRSKKVVVRSVSGTVRPSKAKNRIYKGAKKKSKFTYSGVTVTQHSYSKGDEAKQLFKLEVEGKITIEYSAPAFNLTVKNGTLVEEHPNYAVITGTGSGETIVTGNLYVDSQQSISVNDPLVLQNAQTKIKTFESLYLVGPHNSAAVAQRLYTYYKGNDINAPIILDGETVTDILPIALYDDNEVEAQIEKLSLELGARKIKATVTARYAGG